MVVCLSGWQSLRAEVIDLLPAPDLMGSRVVAGYNATTGDFAASADVEYFTTLISGVPELFGLDAGRFFITANISSTGVPNHGYFFAGGCVLGDLPGRPGCYISNLILLETWDLTALWFDANEITFRFDSVFGALEPMYGDVAYVQLRLVGFPGNFTQSFETSDLSNSASVGLVVPEAVPEPGTWGLLLLGCAGLAWSWNRRISATQGCG
jgi:hypothetical protein